MLSAEIERALNLMSFRQAELAKNELMAKAEDLVNDHFEQIEKNNILKSAQLKNLEGVAFTALVKAPVLNFIQKQANKEDPNKPERSKWTHNDLNKSLSEAINTITTNDVEFVCERLTEEAGQAQIDDNSVETWLTKERKAEVEINMARSFLSYFATYYATKARDFGVTEEDEE